MSCRVDGALCLVIRFFFVVTVVAAWCAETLLFVVCFFVCVCVCRQTLAADISWRDFQNGTEFDSLTDGALLYVIHHLDW